MSERRRNVVWKVMNRRLTILGIERGMFFTSVLLGYTVWTFYEHLPLALGTFVLVALMARWATAEDPEMLRLLLSSGRFRASYDPLKWTDPTVTVRRNA